MSKTPRSLSGKVAVVTGGARGIGQALARALAREGVVVAIGDLDAAAAEATALELANGSIGLALDVTDRAAFTAFLDEVEQRLGPIDILINNAGIMHVTTLEEESDASITRQLEINLHAVIHGTQEAMKRMKPRAHGPHRQHRVARRPRRRARARHLLRDQARRDRAVRGRTRRAARHGRRGHGRDAGLRQDRARQRRAGPARRPARVAGGHRRGHDRRAQGPALRRLGAQAPRRASCGPAPCSRAAPARPSRAR